jgi:hypothetical protein
LRVFPDCLPHQIVIEIVEGNHHTLPTIKTSRSE